MSDTEVIDIYLITARQKREKEHRDLLLREERAWVAARNAAALLKERFRATKVVIFGSLVHKGTFTRWSDVDIAAWGISPEDTFRAIGAVMEMSSDIEVNLVDVGTCRPNLLTVIEEEGVEL